MIRNLSHLASLYWDLVTWPASVCLDAFFETAALIESAR